MYAQTAYYGNVDYNMHIHMHTGTMPLVMIIYLSDYGVLFFMYLCIYGFHGCPADKHIPNLID
jgi:hypothetical protein